VPPDPREFDGPLHTGTHRGLSDVAAQAAHDRLVSRIAGVVLMCAVGVGGWYVRGMEQKHENHEKRIHGLELTLAALNEKIHTLPATFALELEGVRKIASDAMTAASKLWELRSSPPARR
jgi:hypothetical protein